MQEGMLFFYLKDPHSLLYFEQLSLDITGEIHLPYFEKAWNAVTKANEMLRTVFRWEKLEKPSQIILKEHTCHVSFNDLSDLDAEQKKTALEEIKNKDRHNSFDLQEVPFRVILTKLEAQKYTMIISNHHIIYDGWSNGVILKEFFNAYREACTGKACTIPAKSEFKDYVKWMQKQENESAKSFWENYLQDLHAPGDETVAAKRKKRKAIGTTAHYGLQFPAALKERLDHFLKTHNLTLASFLYATWGLLLQNYNTANDIIFDTTVSGRSAKIKGIEEITGLFINTLPLRVQTENNETVLNFLSRFQNKLQQWSELENSSPVLVRETLDKYHYQSLFDSVVVIENYPLDSLTFKETAPLSLLSFSIHERTLYDLTVIITVFDAIDFSITYNTALFDDGYLNELGSHLLTLVEEMMGHPDMAVPKIAVTGHMQMVPQVEAGVEPDFAAPRDAVEEKLVAVWSQVLNIDARVIGIDNSFFDYGGHSLKATLLVSQIHLAFAVKIPLVEIFNRPTIRELAQYIHAAEKQTYTPLPMAEIKNYYPVSSAQHRLYALQQMDPESVAYNVSAAFTVTGKINKTTVERFEKSFKTLIARHEILRTSFEQEQGLPVQHVHDTVAFALEKNDAPVFTGLSAKNNSLADYIKRFIRPFNLALTPLIRVALVKMGDTQHLLIIDLHHILTDAFSMAVLIREFTALCAGEKLAPMTRQFKDFAQWQSDLLLSGQLKAQEEYHLKEFAGEVPVLDLHTDFPRPAVQSFAGDRVHFVLHEALKEKMDRLATATGTTVFMILMAAFNVVLHRYTGQEDIVVGTTVAGRDHLDTQNMMGLFFETLAVRHHPTSQSTFAAFLQDVRLKTLASFENSAYPFRELILKKGLAHDLSRNPFFDVMLIVQNVDMAQLVVEGLTFTPYSYYSQVSKLDITLEAVESAGALKCHIEYSTALSRRESMERLSRHLIQVLETVTVNPGQLIASIELLDEAEKHQILSEFSWSHWDKARGPQPAEGMDDRLENIFARQVAQTPDHIALVNEDTQLTYRQLDEKANQLAKRLMALQK